ncbi:unnamed protein product [Alopecurus aequalis]
MAPSFVLLERDIYITPDEAVSGGRSIRWPWEGRDDPPTRQEMTDVTTEYLRTFKPGVVVADPPELSFLHILLPFNRYLQNLSSCNISSADKNLVALYAGAYRPGSRLPGGYLIYDARKDSLSVIPEIPELPDESDPARHRALGPVSAVVMRVAAGDDYVLAELVGVWPGCSEAALWLWRSSAAGWVLKPRRISLPSRFSCDLCFSFRGSILCWVDLLRGMVLCDILDQDCKLSFIPLPKDCPAYDVLRPKYRHMSAKQFRSMACVRGDIKFVALDDCVQDQPAKGSEVTVWTLSPDLSGWNISSSYSVENIWENEAFQPTGTLKLAPSFPVLSIHEHGVIYLILNHVKELDNRLEYLSQSILRVDMDNQKVKFYPQPREWSINFLTEMHEFSAYRQRLQDHPREIEGSELGASGKRIKL